ncbi:hypothetical protein E5163_02980 [Marinicauda algicola]|uniref:DUF2938 family protein n=1 Tax=Marinicauda algicola TaxID=2029849 RepID=A0A4S2H3Z3_9PROT|nr:DUF6789 family protein [Marinicauda algicola]TGY90108.1 hypothetical protein E5163_02980 [Marinicauda algicola]
MANEVKGIIAGLVATIVLSTLMLIKSAAGMLPDVDAIEMLAGIAARAGLPGTPIVGWILHFLIGAVAWGLLFVWIGTKLPGARVVQGVEFSMLAWLAMMILVFPIAGAGLFGANIGPAAAIATLVLHVIFGAVLGWMYQTLETRQAPPA